MSDELTKLMTCLNRSRGLKQRILFGTKKNEKYLEQVKTEMAKTQSQRNFEVIMKKMKNRKKECMEKFIKFLNGSVLISFLEKINTLLSKFYDDIDLEQQKRLSFTLDHDDTGSIILTYLTDNPDDLYAPNMIMHPFAEYFTLSNNDTSQKYKFKKYKIMKLTDAISQHDSQLQNSLTLYSELISLLKKEEEEEESSIHKFIKYLKGRFGSEINIQPPRIDINRYNVPYLHLHLNFPNRDIHNILNEEIRSLGREYDITGDSHDIFIGWNPDMIAETIIQTIEKERRLKQERSRRRGQSTWWWEQLKRGRSKQKPEPPKSSSSRPVPSRTPGLLKEQESFAQQFGWTGDISTMNKEKLKKKYLELSMKYHPDRNPLTTQQATQKFKHMKNAYDKLLKLLQPEAA